MLRKKIKREVNRFYMYFGMFLTLIMIIWVVTFFFKDFLAFSVTLSVILIYTISKKFPEFSFWLKIETEFNKGDLELYVNEQYKHQKLLNDNRRQKNKSKQLMVKSYVMISEASKLNAKNYLTKNLLILKKLINLESEKKQNNIYDFDEETF